MWNIVKLLFYGGGGGGSCSTVKLCEMAVKLYAYGGEAKKLLIYVDMTVSLWGEAVEL